MKRVEEWDWPPTRRRYRTVDVYQPSGWNSPRVKKAVSIYWQVTITLIKMLIAIPLSLMLIGSIWFVWTVIQVFLTGKA